jgi:hypothetical protein
MDSGIYAEPVDPLLIPKNLPPTDKRRLNDLFSVI